jgi:signal transduction histidine kinase/CheY-like chemotaxis protein
MNPLDNAQGIALICDDSGIVSRVLQNDLDLAEDRLLGSSLMRLAIPASVVKFLNFFNELKDEDAVFNWEINAEIGGELMPLHFSGARNGEDILVVAAKTNENLESLYAEMMQIHNAQVALYRATKKSEFELRAARERDQEQYDLLSSLNNELVTLQRQLVLKNKELERLNDQKNRFLGMAAHDLRNPLMVIMSYSEFLLEDDVPLPPQEVEMVKAIGQSSRFMLSLINDLLDLATIESGVLRLDPQPTDLAEVVARAVTLNNVLAENKGIEIVLTAVPNLPAVSIDRQKITQVLNNLLSNAAKFSPSDTKITVSIADQGHRVLVSVQDQGQGIPAAEIDKLFKPFATSSVKSTAGEKSTGLGLNISRRIVEGHGGHIWVESEQGVGSVFSFTIPVSHDRAASAPPPAPKEEKQTGPLFSREKEEMHILVAEDNKVNQKVVRMQLKKLGLDVDVANNGQEALQAVQEKTYDLVLMDVLMPEMDGLEATKQIRATLPHNAQPRIVALTGGTSPEEKAECIEAGMDDVLTKPIRVQKLKDLLGVD